MNITHHSIRRPLRQWWITRTSSGFKTIPFCPNSQAGTIGPFLHEFTAEAKIEELCEAELTRQIARRAAIVITGLAVFLAACAFVGVRL